MDLIKDIKNTARGVERRVVNVTTSQPVKSVGGFAQDVFSRSTHEAHNVGEAAIHFPAAVGTWKQLIGAAETGKRTVLQGQMPAYPKLAPQALDAAKAAGAGKRVAQPYLQDENKTPHEPVTLFVTGSEDDLVKALKRQGWTQNKSSNLKNYARQFMAVLTHYNRVSDGPVSKMTLAGKAPDLVFSKNVDYNLSRDHMRIYQQGTDPKTGQAVWAIAASRDVAATVTLKQPERKGLLPWNWDWKQPSFGHETDKAIDGERDLIMNDLLASGLVQDFKAVKAVPKGVESKQQPDGSYLNNGYTTDGNLYQVRLG